jgi:hypothetical protein
METSVTLVSCLYWLARTKWQHSGFPPNYDRYASWSENFLSLDANIVIFTDDHYLESVKEKRMKYDPDFTKTVIIKKSLRELESYQKYFYQMSVLMSSPNFKKIKHGDCADNMYPLYNVVQYNKISFLKEVRDTNPFGATHLMWMDCGSCRDGLEKYKGRKFPTNTDLLNDKIIHFSHNLEFGLGDVKQHYFLSQIRNIQGTSWVMPVQHVDTYHHLMFKELEDTMAAGFIGSDEKAYDSIYQSNKDLIHLVKCGWFQFFDVMSQVPEKTVQPTEPTPPQEEVVVEESPVLSQEVVGEPVVENQEDVDVTPVVSEPISATTGDAIETEEFPVLSQPDESNPVISQQDFTSVCGTPALAMASQQQTVPQKSWWRRMIGA